MASKKRRKERTKSFCACAYAYAGMRIAPIAGRSSQFGKGSGVSVGGAGGPMATQQCELRFPKRGPRGLEGKGKGDDRSSSSETT